MHEENLLQTILKQESWDDLIVQVVSMENLDPWDVDLVKLTDSFLKYIETLERLDFRIPAKVVLVAAVLLKLKSEILNPVLRVPQTENPYNGFNIEAEDFEGIKQRLSGIELKPGVVRKVKRKVTLDELVDALRKAVKVSDRRNERKIKLGNRVGREINVNEEDIEQRIMSLLGDIDGLLAELDAENVEFSKIVKEWSRDEIVAHLMPLLHLSTRGDVNLRQDDFFKEIFISRKS